MSYHTRRCSPLVKVAALACATVILSGCAFFRGNFGEQYHTEDIEAIQKGTSTEHDVAARLGAPDRILEINGQTVFQYYSYELKSATLLFFSRTNITGQDLYVFFNGDGIAKEVVFGKPKTPPKFQFWPFGK